MVGGGAQRAAGRLEAGGEQDREHDKAPRRAQDDRVGERGAGVARRRVLRVSVALGTVVAADEHEPAAGADRGDDGSTSTAGGVGRTRTSMAG